MTTLGLISAIDGPNPPSASTADSLSSTPCTPSTSIGPKPKAFEEKY